MHGTAQPHRSPPLRTIPPGRPQWYGNKVVDTLRAGGATNERNEATPLLRVPLSSLPARDGALQTAPGKTDTPPPSLTFDGVSNMCGCYPPDTNGDVGGTQYMQWVNLHFAIYNKTTGAQVQAPRPGNQLFTGVPVCGTTNSGDPVTIYDQYAGRWVASQFGPTGAPPYYQCIAVSTTDDATGTWCAYGFNVHNTKFNDYPKMGVWPSQHAYTMTANQFPPSGFGGVGVWAFERDQMIAPGCPAARFVYQDMDAIEPYLGTMIPADADGATPPRSMRLHRSSRSTRTGRAYRMTRSRSGTRP